MRSSRTGLTVPTGAVVVGSACRYAAAPCPPAVVPTAVLEHV